MERAEVSGTRFEIQTFDALPRPLREQVDALLTACFTSSQQTDERRRESEDRFCSDGDIIKYVLALHEHTVVGVVIVLKRQIAFRGREVQLGGLGGVCTAPDQRRKGIASSLVAQAMGELRAAGCDIAYLCTDIEGQGTAKLYGRAGFVPLGRPHIYQGRSGKQYVDNDAMIAPITSPELFQQVLNAAEPFAIGNGNW